MTNTPIERDRIEAVQALFDGLVRFSRALKARSGDWGHAAHDLTRGDIVALGVLEARGSTRPGQIAAALNVDPSVISRQLVTPRPARPDHPGHRPRGRPRRAHHDHPAGP